MVEFVCVKCNASYAGETQRHIKTSIDEHLHANKKSHVFQHLAGNESCKSKCDESCFKVVNTAFSGFRLNVKEALHIKCSTTTLNGKKQQRILLISL